MGFPRITGHTVTSKGYRRITSGPDRHQYEHRAIVRRMADSWCYWSVGGRGMPDGWDVHHMDNNKLNNCPCNLLLIPHTFHSALTHHQAKWRVEWATKNGNCIDEEDPPF